MLHYNEYQDYTLMVAVLNSNATTELSVHEILLEYFRVTKPRVVSLIILTGFVSLFIAKNGINVTFADLIFSVLSGYLAVGGSHAINAYIDRNADNVMRRTKHRPLASGKINHPEIIIAMGTIMIILGSTVAFIAFNKVTALLVLAGALFYVFIYSVLLKYRTSWNTVIGGIAGVLPILAGAAASNPSGYIPLNGWIFAGILFLWQPSHFWALAIYVKDDYLEAKIPMLPVVFGSKLTAKVIMASVVVTFFFALLFPLTGQTSIVFGILMSLMGLVLIKSSYELYKVSDKIDSPLKDEYRKMALSNFKIHNIYLGLMSVLLMVDMAFFHPIHLFFLHL